MNTQPAAARQISPSTSEASASGNGVFAIRASLTTGFPLGKRTVSVPPVETFCQSAGSALLVPLCSSPFAENV